MRRIAKFRKQRMCALTAAIVASAWMPTAMALPTNEDVVKKDGASVAWSTDKTMDVTVSAKRSAIDWKTFNVDQGETVNFRGSTPGWTILNRVSDGASTINGAIKSFVGDVKGGTVFLINPQGITFGNSACVEVGSLVASTLWVDDDERKNFLENNTNKININFNQKGEVGAKITNLGNIDASADGVVALLAHEVVSNGTVKNKVTGADEKNHITAGQVAMAAGKNITLDLVDVQYDDKISVRFHKQLDNGVVTSDGVTINETEADHDEDASVINASTITAERGYVLMKACEAREVGANLIRQTGVVTAKKMTQDESGNIILQAEQVKAGGKLYANGKNGKISIRGNSTITAEAHAGDEDGENGVINIDSDKGGNVVLAGKLSAGKKVITKSNHSVIVLDKMTGDFDGDGVEDKLPDTEVSVNSKDPKDGWYISASRVNIADSWVQKKEVAGSWVPDEKKSLIVKYDEVGTVCDDVIKAYIKNPATANVLDNAFSDLGYKVSSNVINNALKNTNVNITTAVDKDHHVDYINHDIVIDAEIVKQSGDDTTSLTMNAFNETDRADYIKSMNKRINTIIDAMDKAAIEKAIKDYTGKEISIDGEKIGEIKEEIKKGIKDCLNNNVKVGNIVLNKDITTGEGKGGALNVALTAGNIIVNSNDGERTIKTYGTNTHGTVEINGKTDSDTTGNLDTLTIKSGDTTINGDVGAINKLENLKIYSKGKIEVKGDVMVTKDMIARATDAPEKGNYLDVKNAVDEKNVSVKNVSAGNIVNLAADNNVIVNGNITAKAPKNGKAVEIVAQGNFENSGNGITTASDSNWKIYSNNPKDDNFGDLSSENLAEWGWGSTVFVYNNNDNPAKDAHNRYIFKVQPVITYTANESSMRIGEAVPSLSYSGPSYTLNGKALAGQYTSFFRDGNIDTLKRAYGLDTVKAVLDNSVDTRTVKVYENGVVLDTKDVTAAVHGYTVNANPAKFTVIGELKPQLDTLTTSNLKGSASYSQAARQVGPGADRVLGLQSAELPFFREENGQTKLYGTYDVSIDPDKVKMEPTAKVLPEPDQPQNQYREYDKELTTQAGTAKFKMTYNGSTFDIYPVDSSAKNLLVAGDAAKNVEVESQALFAAFKEMGITLDDLDGVYTHFDSKKEVQSFRK